VTLKEAAQLLGISKEAVRKRVQRGTLPSDVGEDGRRYVYLDAVDDDGGDDVPPESSSTSGPVEDSRDELVATLREQLAAEREANRENRRLLAAALERIPAIEPPEAPGASETDEGELFGTSPQEAEESLHEP
jgi:excisionase family DNA binding protein